MRAIKAVIDNGRIVPDETLDMVGRHDAIVVVLDVDPWDAILQDPRPLPELVKAREQAEEDYRQGRTTPLDPDTMP